MSLVWRRRVVVARDEKSRWYRRWRWAVEEQKGLRGAYQLKQDGWCLTRQAAVDTGTRSALPVFTDLDRIELEVVDRQPPVEGQPAKPTPLPVELLEPEGAE